MGVDRRLAPTATALGPLAAVALMLCSAAGPSAAQELRHLEIAADAAVTATDNGNESATQPQSDVLVSLRPRIQFARRGTGLSIVGSAEADMIGSTRGSRPSRILPAGAINAEATLIDRVLRIDAGARVSQVEQDVFGARLDGNATLGKRTAGTYRAAPVLEMEGPSGTLLTARYDLTRTRFAGTDVGDTDSRIGSVRFGMRPRPLGVGLEWNSESTDYAGVGVDVRSERLAGLLATSIYDEWLLGVLAGRERSELAGQWSSDAFYGFRASWVPGPRTKVSASLERHYFGNGGRLDARHRTPSTAVVLEFVRDPVNAGTATVVAPGLNQFLDAILTTRNPDEAARQALVDSLIAGRGLQGTALGATAAHANYPQLRTGGQFGWVFLQARTTLTVTATAQQFRRLQRLDGVTAGAATDDFRLRGVSLGWNRRLTPQLSLDVGADRVSVEGLANRLGESTRERAVRAGLTQNLSPKTNGSLGLRFRRVSSNVAETQSFDETAIFVGLGHRF